MKILPKIGVDDIQLGMNKKQVQEILGKPDQLEKDSDEERWEFDAGIELSFEKEDLYLLGSITVFDDSARLESQPIIGISEKDLLENFPHFLPDEDFGENGKSYDSEELQILAWVHEGTVVNITLFPEYESTGQIPIWPKPRA